MFKKKIVFLTGTRADYGKLKALITAVRKIKKFDPIILATGMHMEKEYGKTYIEILKDFRDIKLHKFKNQKKNKSMDTVLATTITSLNKILKKIQPDLVVVHGDRIETLAASICCNLNNILIAHIEGGEVSGTVDECIRHATTKFSHIHFVSNQKAKKIIQRLGEVNRNIYVMGSPEVDIMIKKDLPSIDNAKKRYKIDFENYSILLYHPVTTLKKSEISKQCTQLFAAIKKSKKKFIIIYPNNDTHSDVILSYIKKLKNNNSFKILPSIRFEYYLTLLKNSECIIGNSSSGIREAPVYGVRAINLGNRQKNRINQNNLIKNISFDQKKILKEIINIKKKKKKSLFNFGKGNSSSIFIKTLKSKNLWMTNRQKYFA